MANLYALIDLDLGDQTVKRGEEVTLADNTPAQRAVLAQLKRRGVISDKAPEPGPEETRRTRVRRKKDD